METLERLLHPYPVDRFLSENWTQQGLFVATDLPDRFSHLFSWERLNYLLNYHRYKHPDLRFSLDGKTLPPCSPTDWVKRCQDGATLILNHIHELDPTLAQWTSALSREIGHRTQTNTYCSWPSQQGFNCHFDPHEVFILQIDGFKEWFVFEETLEYPCKSDKSPDLQPPDSPPYLNCILSPGDVLYIPRGHWHYAIARTAPSLHLTLGITCRTGIDWLNWLVGKLQNDRAWRQNLPLVPNSDTGPFDRHLQNLSDRLVELLEEQKLTREFTQEFTLSGDRNPEIALPTQVGFDLFDKGLDTRFRPPKYQPVRIEFRAKDEYCICTLDRQIDLKGVTPECVENLFCGKSFSIWDVAEWLPNCDLETELLPLLLRLIEAQMLLVEEDAGIHEGTKGESHQ